MQMLFVLGVSNRLLEYTNGSHISKLARGKPVGRQGFQKSLHTLFCDLSLVFRLIS